MTSKHLPWSVTIGTMVMAAPTLQADPADKPRSDVVQDSAALKRHVKSLKRMQADRSLDDEHTRQAKKEFRKSNAELSGHDEQQQRDIQNLKSVEGQVATGQDQKAQAHQSYKEAVHQYGTDDPRSSAARQDWNESRQAMVPLLESRRALKAAVHQEGRQVHNDKTVLSVQKRDMASDARYRAIDDRRIVQQEMTIADDRRALAEIISTPK